MLEEQLKIEQESLAQGQLKYFKEIEDARSNGKEDTLGPVRSLMRRSLALVSQAVSIKRQPRRGQGRGLAAIPLIEGIEDEALAFHVLRGLFSGVSTESKMTATAVAIGTAVFEEQRFRAMQEQQGKLYRMTQEHLKSATTGRRRRKIMRHMSQSTEAADWTTREKLLVGMFLIDCVVESTTLFEIRIKYENGQTISYIVATREVLDWLNAGHDRLSMFLPIRMPMVHPPKPWTAPDDGGYLTDAGGKLRIIKIHGSSSGHLGEYLRSLNDVDMPTVYSALNAVQAVAWSINTDILRVASECWDRGIAVGSSMPLQEHLPLPAAPCAPEELPQLKKDNPEAYKLWARKAAAVHEENGRAVSKRISCAERLNVATRFAQYPAIYFPHTLDFRGRMYPVPLHLHPQADDLARGLLQFAEGAVPGERGLYWLAVHIANCHGVDKVSHAERVAWVQARMPLWRAIAQDPMEYRDWMKADDPWQALAAILDYVRCTDDGTAVSRLSIPMDGSCNGLQNFSAMLRDPVGGAATNLIPQSKPADVYGEVARIVAQLIEQDAATGDEFAIGWLGKITRKLVKQPVMTLPYGATLAGMRQQLADATHKLYPALWPKDKEWAACGYLAKRTYEAIGRVVVAARDAMEWLQEVAKIVSSTDYPVRWTAPNGLPILQDYRTTTTKEVSVHVDGMRMRLELQERTDKLDKRRQSLAISPNLVHSFDASHLMGTVCECLNSGLTTFAFIHDSYGTLAAHVDLMHRCLRRAFIAQYSRDLLAEFRDEVQAQLPAGVVLPPPPAPGTLDLEQVMDSAYFFS